MKGGGKVRSPMSINSGPGDRGRAKIRAAKELPQSQKIMRTKEQFLVSAARVPDFLGRNMVARLVTLVNPDTMPKVA